MRKIQGLYDDNVLPEVQVTAPSLTWKRWAVAIGAVYAVFLLAFNQEE